MIDNSIIILVGDSENIGLLDIPLPEEILDIIMSNLGEEDLNNLIEVGNDRIKHSSNRRLKKLLWIKSKFFHRTIMLISITSYRFIKKIVCNYITFN